MEYMCSFHVRKILILSSAVWSPDVVQGRWNSELTLLEALWKWFEVAVGVVIKVNKHLKFRLRYETLVQCLSGTSWR